jgi:hypothetical protein
MASLALSGLPKALRGSAENGDNTETALSGYDGSRVTALINDTFSTPQNIPGGIEMIRHTFVIGGGKSVRGKYPADLPKNITAALRAIGYEEDKSADTSASSAGTFKRQHDTGANLIYCHVYPNVVSPSSGAAGETKGSSEGGDESGGSGVVGLSDMFSRPMNLCIHAEMSTFHSMVDIEVKRWSQKKNLLDQLVTLVKKHTKITDKLVNREPLTDEDQRIFELDAEDMKEKAQWLKEVMKQQVEKQDLTEWDLHRLINLADEKLIKKTDDEKLLARIENLKKTPPRPLSFKGRDQLLPLYVKLFDIQKQAGSSASVKQLTAIKATQDQIEPLERMSNGWFEENHVVVKRLDALKAVARTMKAAAPKKKSGGGSRGNAGNRGPSRKVSSGNGGWATVAKKKGNRFAAFD